MADQKHAAHARDGGRVSLVIGRVRNSVNLKPRKRRAP